MPNCIFHRAIPEFNKLDPKTILSDIVDSIHGIIPDESINAWKGEIQIMKSVLEDVYDNDSHIIFEYDIPRLGKRVDVILLIKGIVFCLEFKVGNPYARQGDVEQVLDYALDLKSFHHYSFDKPIIPILIPTEYKTYTTNYLSSAYDDEILNPIITGKTFLKQTLTQLIKKFQTKINSSTWGRNWILSPYSPTPTIIEAARSLYENHTVDEIIRHEADKVFTDRTTNYILDVIDYTKKNKQKSICFVTGVPGAGKTLVGLDVAIKQSYNKNDASKEDGAVYLSGNGPLVAVLTEALAIDNYKQCKEKGEKKNLSDSRREVHKFIQIIHQYRDQMLAKIKNPIQNEELKIDPQKAQYLDCAGYGEVEHIAIFDEAQRSWTHEHLANYLKRGGTYGNKMKVNNFPMSEAEFLIWSLDQREDWAVIVCLVGGGQEINTGEAGITEWINAVNHKFKHWNIFISPHLSEKEYANGEVNDLLKDNVNVTFSDDLHLAVSLRSFRAEKLSSFVHALLAIDPEAKKIFSTIDTDKYPIFLTRDMAKARTWLRRKARGHLQTGVLVSKVAARFKPQAVNVLAQGDENAVHWFLEDKDDVRSSNYLEEAATEIQVQGLELDYSCVLWDADMRFNNNEWEYYKFNGKTRWIPENNEDNRKYMLNAYRVLLTRSRQGMVICVPLGNNNLNSEGFPEDPTRLPECYDGTYKYLKSLGIKEL